MTKSGHLSRYPILCDGTGKLPTGECRVAMSGPTCMNPDCPPCQTPETDDCPGCSMCDLSKGEGDA